MYYYVHTMGILFRPLQWRYLFPSYFLKEWDFILVLWYNLHNNFKLLHSYNIIVSYTCSFRPTSNLLLNISKSLYFNYIYVYTTISLHIDVLYIVMSIYSYIYIYLHCTHINQMLYMQLYTSLLVIYRLIITLYFINL